ncbi:MAG: M23 family peptidase, partial [Ruminococcaceae bacterium]|nr:M23 family peptidase [Oscillospiraceae bacterium]
MAFVATSIIMLCMTGAKEKDFIRYVEFNITYPALETAMKLDIDSQDDEIKLNWIDMLAYLGAKYGGDFSSYKESDLKSIAKKLSSGEKISDLTKEMKYYSYYREAYGAVLDGFLGEYTEKSTDENGKTTETKKYGLKVYSPIAKTFPYSHY